MVVGGLDILRTCTYFYIRDTLLTLMKEISINIQHSHRYKILLKVMMPSASKQITQKETSFRLPTCKPCSNPILPTSVLLHSHQRQTTIMLLTAQSFCEGIRCHILCRDILQPYGLIGEALPDEMMTDIDVFRPCVRNGVLGEGEGALIVSVNDRGLCWSIS